jgi:hypothetical protein
MLLYGGIGLLMAGIIIFFFSGQIQKDPAKAAKARKQAPVLAAVGAVMLAVRFLIAA